MKIYQIWILTCAYVFFHICIFACLFNDCAIPIFWSGLRTRRQLRRRASTQLQPWLQFTLILVQTTNNTGSRLMHGGPEKQTNKLFLSQLHQLSCFQHFDCWLSDRKGNRDVKTSGVWFTKYPKIWHKIIVRSIASLVSSPLMILYNLSYSCHDYVLTNLR